MGIHSQTQTGYKYYDQGVIHTNIYYFQLNENVKLRLDLSPCDYMNMWQIWSHAAQFWFLTALPKLCAQVAEIGGAGERR